MTTDNRTNESYEKLIRKLVSGLRVDAGDYAFVAQGISKSHELSWYARNQRAWDAATALEAMLDDRDAGLAEVERAAAEKAWEEGAEAAFYNPEIRGLVDYPYDNPYRAAALGLDTAKEVTA